MRLRDCGWNNSSCASGTPSRFLATFSRVCSGTFLLLANATNCSRTTGSLRSLPSVRLRIGALGAIPSPSINSFVIVFGAGGVSFTGGVFLRPIPGNDICDGITDLSVRSGIRASIPSSCVASGGGVTSGVSGAFGLSARCTLTALRIVFVSSLVALVFLIPAALRRFSKFLDNVL